MDPLFTLQATCFRSWSSFFEILDGLLPQKNNLKSLAPLLYSNLTVWETGYTKAHAEPFTRYHGKKLVPPLVHFLVPPPPPS